jgi:hypothetical protein
MFEISVIILSRLLLVAAGYLLYRKFYGWEDFEKAVKGRSGVVALTTPKTQQGFIWFDRFATTRAKPVKLNMRDLDVRTPWGW